MESATPEHIAAILGAIAVRSIFVVIGEVARDAPVPIGNRMAFIHQLCPADVVHVHGIFHVNRVVAVPTVLHADGIEAVSAILRRENEISGAVFGLNLIRGRPQCLLIFHREVLRAKLLKSSVRKRCELANFFEVFLLRVLLIGKTVLLASEIAAEKTVLAVDAVVAKTDIFAAPDEVAEECAIASPSVVGLIAKFTSLHHV